MFLGFRSPNRRDSRDVRFRLVRDSRQRGGGAVEERPSAFPPLTNARLGVLVEAAGSNGADLVILDTAPNADQTALRAAQVADLVLIPCRAATFDLEATLMRRI